MTQDQENTPPKKPRKKAPKERVLHTRIPAVLEEELKQLADNLRIPVSNLVRAVLQDTIDAAEAMGRVAEQELRGAAERLAHQRERLRDVAANRGQEWGERAAARIRRGRGEAPTLRHESEAAVESGSETDHSNVILPPGREAGPGSEQGETPAGQPAALEGVLGFQEFILAKEARCDVCQRTLATGETAYLGLRDTAGPRVVIGPECLPGRKESES